MLNKKDKFLIIIGILLIITIYSSIFYKLAKLKSNSLIIDYQSKNRNTKTSKIFSLQEKSQIQDISSSEISTENHHIINDQGIYKGTEQKNSSEEQSIVQVDSSNDTSQQKIDNINGKGEQKADEIYLFTQSKADEANDTTDKINKQKDNLLNKGSSLNSKLNYLEANYRNTKQTLKYLALKNKKQKELVNSQSPKSQPNKKQITIKTTKNKKQIISKTPQDLKIPIKITVCSDKCVNVCKVNNSVFAKGFVNCAKNKCLCKDINQIYRSI